MPTTTALAHNSKMVAYDYYDTGFRLDLADETERWLLTVATHHGRHVGQLTYIFTSREHHRYLNEKYLSHTDDTDILTFDYSEGPTSPVVADVFISIDQVKDNAREFTVPFVDELHRVMVHGLLHLMGYDDHSPTDKARMQQQEDLALNLRLF
ncbi:MAG: rRNA maturation RNase YbeY [Bacteroidia bacterium]|nr:rRNA maturation RNase YbeY [Bacteroidia bacterium]